MKTRELKFLRDKCLFFNQFMIENGSLPIEMIMSITESNKLIEEAHKNGRLKPLRTASADIDHQILKNMSISMVLDLKVFLMKNLQMSLEAIEKVQRKAISKVLKKGKVSVVDEYELILNRIYEINNDTNKQVELDQLNTLLTMFDKNAIIKS